MTRSTITVGADGVPLLTAEKDFPAKSGSTTTTTVTNPDGSSTITTSSAGDGSDGSGIEDTTNEEEEFGTLSLETPGDDLYSEETASLDELNTYIGEDSSFKSSFESKGIFGQNPFNSIGSSEGACQTVTLSLWDYTTTFPSSEQCEKLNSFKKIIEWFMYAMVLFYAIRLITKRPV